MATKANKRIAGIFTGLMVALALSSFLAVMTGPVGVKPFLVIRIWLHKLSAGALIEKTWTRIPETIVLDLRTPRLILSALVGAGLAVSGAAMQGLFRNPMAEPYVLGMSSGAAVGASLALVLGLGKCFGVLSLPILAFAGSHGYHFCGL